MKWIAIIFSFAIVSLSFGQQEELSIEKLDSVRQKLKTDTVSYEQFVLLAQCSCQDQLTDSSQLFTEVFNELFDMWTPFVKLVGNPEGLSSYNQETFSAFYEETKIRLKEKDEKIRNSHSATLFCDRMYSRKRSWWLYFNFIDRPGTLTGLSHYFDEYLKENSVVINNEGM